MMTTALDYAGLIGQAHGIATIAHRGQTDKAGCPYIEHPRRVADKLVHPEDKIVALLHDVLEDTDVLHADLVDLFDEEIADTVLLLTRAHGTYDAYVEEICASGNMRAIRVKLADVLDNSDPNRLQALVEMGQPGVAIYLRDKYARSREKLEAALGVPVTGS